MTSPRAAVNAAISQLRDHAFYPGSDPRPVAQACLRARVKPRVAKRWARRLRAEGLPHAAQRGNRKLRSLLLAGGWERIAANPTYIYAESGSDDLELLANSLDIAATNPENPNRAALAVARDEAARLAWPPPANWQEELVALRVVRESMVG